MKEKKFYQNIIFAFIFQLVNMAFPLIVSPYITRVLGVANYGKVNYAINIVNILVVFAVFGTNIYGIKQMSKLKDNKEAKSEFISSIIDFKFLTCILTSLIFIGLSFGLFKTNLLLFLIEGLLIISSIYSLDWIFQYEENYQYIAVRTAIIKLITLIFIFTLVKSNNDYIMYALITVASTIAGYAISYKYIKREYDIKLFQNKNNIPLFKNLLIFLLITIAGSIYGYIDTVILGSLTSEYDVGLYSLARTIIISITSITMTISSAVMPRINSLFNEDKSKYNELLNISYNLLISFAIPLMFGCIAIATEIVYLLGGENYAEAIPMIVIMSPIILINSIWTWNYYQRIIPNNKERKILIYQLIMLLIISLLNVFLDINNKGIGSSIAFLVSEIFGFISCWCLLNKSTKFNYINANFFKYLTSGFFMFLVLYIVKKNISKSLILIVPIGVLVYYFGLLILHENLYYDVYVKITIMVKEKLKNGKSKI